jgi:tRNA A37 threonylcarbamoyladenosine dehydratase
MDKYFGRTELVLGLDGMNKLKDSRIALFGLGGVGSFAFEALVRSGVGYIQVTDFDKITSSNFNRQLLALHSSQGTQKVEVAKKRAEDINPDIIIKANADFFHIESADYLLPNDIDYVIDAIDSVGPKTELLYQCSQKGIPVITSMGASARTDPSLVRMGSLWESTVCPLARAIRRNLRKRGVNTDIMAVYSIEESLNTYPPEEINERSDISFERGRKRRVLPSMGILPGIIGLILANHVLLEVSGYKSQTESTCVKENEDLL